MESWLTFTSTLIWQLIVLTALFIFRAELKSLLQRLSRFKAGDTEVEFQQALAEEFEPASGASNGTDSEDFKPSPVVSSALNFRDGEGFFTRHGVEELVRQYLKPEENISQALLVFSTTKQHTWLISTKNNIFYILDDERTRAKQQLVQSRLKLSQALPVKTEHRSSTVGVFRLGEMSYWYYSYELLGTPSTAKQRLEEFVRQASNMNRVAN